MSKKNPFSAFTEKNTEELAQLEAELAAKRFTPALSACRGPSGEFRRDPQDPP